MTTVISDATDADTRQFVTKQDLQIELAPLRADQVLMKWMLGVNTALVIGLFVKAFIP